MTTTPASGSALLKRKSDRANAGNDHNSSNSVFGTTCQDHTTWSPTTSSALVSTVLRSRGSLQLANHELGAQVLRVRIVRVLQVLSIDAVAVSRVANTVALKTRDQLQSPTRDQIRHPHRCRHPASWKPSCLGCCPYRSQGH